MSRLSILLILLGYSVLLTAQNSHHRKYDAVRPGTTKAFDVHFTHDMSSPNSWKVVVIKGQERGPVFTIAAGIHGYEYPPILATQKIIQELDPKKLKGTVLIVPIANPGSFFHRSPYKNPIDDLNLNRIFPGKSGGSVTERMAYFMSNTIISYSDVFLDIHGGDAPEDLMPFVCYYNNTKRPEQTALARRLSEKSGFETVVSYPYSLSKKAKAKYAFKQAVQYGITGLSIECGKMGQVEADEVERIRKAIFNMLYEMGMYTDHFPLPEQLQYLEDQIYLKSTVDGIFYSELKAGDLVKKGQLVGYTTDLLGETIEEYKSPKDGIILYKLATPPINTDETVMCISSLAE